MKLVTNCKNLWINYKGEHKIFLNKYVMYITRT